MSDSFEGLMRLADQALYRSKSTGRNRSRVTEFELPPGRSCENFVTEP